MVKHKKILVIENDSDLLESMQVLLESEGFQASCISSGIQFISRIKTILKTVLPDLIILDVWLTGVRGDTIVEAIRNEVGYRNIPILLISADSTLALIAKNCKADDYLVKPFQLDSLLTKVRSHL